MREWVRAKAAEVPSINQLPLDVPNQTSSHGVDENYIRYSLQMGEAQVIGVGSGIKRRRRIGRIYLEVFAALGDGEGLISQQANDLEEILRVGSDSAFTPHQDITIFEPSTFDRPEGGRYCQVVNARIQVDLFS